jgi:hypothetical protein
MLIKFGPVTRRPSMQSPSRKESQGTSAPCDEQEVPGLCCTRAAEQKAVTSRSRPSLLRGKEGGQCGAAHVGEKAVAKPTRQRVQPVSSGSCPTHAHARAEPEHQKIQVTNLPHFTTLLFCYYASCSFSFFDSFIPLI